MHRYLMLAVLFFISSLCPYRVAYANDALDAASVGDKVVVLLRDQTIVRGTMVRQDKTSITVDEDNFWNVILRSNITKIRKMALPNQDSFDKDAAPDKTIGTGGIIVASTLLTLLILSVVIYIIIPDRRQ